MCARTVGNRTRRLPRMNSRSMHMRIIKKRLRALEAVTRFSAGCKCRFLHVTFFHSAADLERIMSVRCPVHVFCDLGELSWAPFSMPLRTEDRPLCSCPPSPTREWLDGKRGPLTEGEQTQECRGWEQALSEDPEDKMRVEVLLNNYYKAKRRRNETMR
jgi:hypothetical protein